MTDRTTLMARLDAVAQQLKVASTWQSKAAVSGKTTDAFVYELACFLSLCVALEKAGNTLDVVERRPRVDGKVNDKEAPRALWPKSPALKENFSYATIKAPGASMHGHDLNPGIDIEDRYGKLRAPDLSITTSTSDRTPKHDEVVALWDAKFTTEPAKPLADTQVSDFLFTAAEFGFPRAMPPLVATLGDPAFSRPGLITNAGQSSEKDGVYWDREMQETYHYPDNPKVRPDYPRPAPSVTPAAPAVAPKRRINPGRRPAPPAPQPDSNPNPPRRLRSTKK